MKQSQTRQTIIETASTLFYQKGYNLTGINEIIREAGIAKATLYSHFRSKDDICIAYLEHKNEGFMMQLKDYLSKQAKGKKRLLAIFDFLELFFNNENFNGCWCINTTSEIPRENVAIRRKIQNQKSDFLKLIEEQTFENLPKRSKKDNETLAKRIYLLYEGALTESHIHLEDWPIAAARDLCVQILK